MEDQGKKIAYYRRMEGWTQAELGDRIGVTAQAVSKWENGISEPDLSTVKKLCELFGVTVDKFLATEEKAEMRQSETAAAAAFAPTAAVMEPQLIIGYCEGCKKPLKQNDRYEVETRARSNVQHIFCETCYAAKLREENDNKYLEERNKLFKGLLIGGIIAVILAIISIVLSIVQKNAENLTLLVVALAAFTMTVQCFYDGWIQDCFEFFIRSFNLPGIIFSLDLDGIIWFITVKLGLMILGAILSAVWFLFGLVITLAVSLVTFPFSIAFELRALSDLKSGKEAAK